MTTRFPVFTLTELRQGWLDFRLEDGHKTCDFSVASVFSEPLRDLCDALVDAHDAVHGGGVTPFHFEFEWLGEGWLYFWEMKPEGETLNVKATFAGSRVVGDRPATVWELETAYDRSTFAEAVWTLAGSIIREHGLVGYRHLWGRDFPMAQLLSLRQTLDKAPISGWQSELEALAGLG